MRIRRWLTSLVTIALLLAAQVAGADSPVGSWSGSARGAGMKLPASATFGADGSCTLSAGGYSASGSWSGGRIKVSAQGHSATLSYSVSGSQMTISGKYKGKRGSMSLTRRGGGEEGDTDSSQLYGHWAFTQKGTGYEVYLYGDGWLLWSEGSEAVPTEYGTTLKVRGKTLELKPLTPDADSPALWIEYWDADKGIWAIPYAEEDGILTFFPLSEQELRFEHQGGVDRKPDHSLFSPYVVLERGDRGEAVRQLQERLIALGHLEAGKNAADGIYGANTQAAVRALQKALGMKADGVAWPQVRTALTQY